MTESLRCSPETITMLLISYTPIKNKKLKRKKKCTDSVHLPCLRYFALFPWILQDNSTLQKE